MKKVINEIEALIPVSMELDWPTKDEIVKCIREQNKLFGFKKFLLAAPGAGHRSNRYPDTAIFEDLALLYKEIKKELSDSDITLGWWDTLTIKSGSSSEFQPIVKKDGEPHPFANCPLDENFRKIFSKNVAAFSRIAAPSFIVFEDDYSVNAAAGGCGCFCPLHLNEFAKREGRVYTRKELLEIFEKRDEESLALLRRYRDLSRDSLVGLSEKIREELDKENPEIPIGLSQPGSADLDGDMTEAVCRALAGKNHTPFSRICGAYYGGGELKGIPKQLYHAIYSREHIKGDFKFYHESDTFPHTRFFSSAKQMKAFMGIAYSSGFIGSMFQTQQLLDDPNEEQAYGKMFCTERKRFTELISLVSKCERVGVSLPYDPFYNTLDGMFGSQPYWIRTLDLFGIPYITRRSNVAFIDSRQAKYCTDDEIIKYLSGGLFLDGDAALELERRGFGKYIGVSVGEDVAENGKNRYDLGAREILKEPFDQFSKGKNMPSAHMLAHSNGVLRELTVTCDKVEVISEAYSFNREMLSVAMTRYKNELGGRIVVMGMTVKDNLSQSLFNYRRMKLFHQLLGWCGASLPHVKEDPCVHLILNEAKDKEDFTHLITLINLGDDTIESPALYLPESMRGRKIFSLNSEGEWIEPEYIIADDGIILTAPLELCEPVYLKI